MKERIKDKINESRLLGTITIISILAEGIFCGKPFSWAKEILIWKV